MLKQKNVMIYLVVCLFTITSFGDVLSIVGTDQRKHLYELSDPKQKEYVLGLAKSICLITTLEKVAIVNKQIRLKVDGTIKQKLIKGDFNKDGTVFSNNIKFLEQPAINLSATGFLVADNMVATAYHVPKELMMIPPCGCEYVTWNGECFDKNTCDPNATWNFNYGKLVAVFGYYEESENEFAISTDGYINIPLSKGAISKITSVVSGCWDFNMLCVDKCLNDGLTEPYKTADYIILKLETPLSKDKFPPLKFDRTGIIPNILESCIPNKIAFALGFPEGMPMKYAESPNLAKFNVFTDLNKILFHTIDTWGGNSGSPIFIKDPIPTEEMVAIAIQTTGIQGASISIAKWGLTYDIDGKTVIYKTYSDPIGRLCDYLCQTNSNYPVANAAFLTYYFNDFTKNLLPIVPTGTGTGTGTVTGTGTAPTDPPNTSPGYCQEGADPYFPKSYPMGSGRKIKDFQKNGLSVTFSNADDYMFCDGANWRNYTGKYKVNWGDNNVEEGNLGYYTLVKACRSCYEGTACERRIFNHKYAKKGNYTINIYSEYGECSWRGLISNYCYGLHHDWDNVSSTTVNVNNDITPILELLLND